MSKDPQRVAIDTSLKIFIALSRVHHRLMDISNRSAQSYGLNPTEFAVLEILYHKGTLALQQIGDKILITSGSITYVVDKLEKKKLVKRNPCKEDRRVIYAELTDAGKQLMDDIFPSHELLLHESLTMLNSEEKDQLLTLLKKVGKHQAIEREDESL
ncbi:MarR family winged helix-turn-helix transcriptional regulator [Ectobacillus sp. sgz5001026]|uniref:MarR family winged helix-turn-helix transcriptional regulator n=1 Tax=Ectobacillus sp. sgz5001026 TaxID=3242473 RepID=UPI0036D22208